MHALEELQAEFDTELLFVESGGDNLAANYSRELADYIIYVVSRPMRGSLQYCATLEGGGEGSANVQIDVAGGDKVPRKGGPGISQSDLFIINKVGGCGSKGSLQRLHRPQLDMSCHLADSQTDLAPHVGASLDVMRRDSAIMREKGPTLFTSVCKGEGVQDVVDAILGAWAASGAKGKNTPKQK